MVPVDVPIAQFTEQQRQDFLHGEARKIKVEGINLTYEGLVPKIQKSMLSKDVDALQPHVRAFVRARRHLHGLPRLRRHPPERGGPLVEDRGHQHRRRLRDADQRPRRTGSATSTSRRWRRCSTSLGETLDSFVEIGLGYLSLDRSSGTLSGGEAQRTKMIRHLGSSLTDVTYVFDEPTIGLHPHDIQRMNDLLLRLRDKGNTVLVVEHKPEAIAIADHVVDLGPGRGHGRRRGVSSRAPSRACAPAARSPAGTSTTGPRSSTPVRTPTGALEVRGASAHNLRDVDVDIPLGVLCVLTGVAGSGKSSLVRGSVSGRDGVVTVDQGAIKGSRRSNPATYTGLLEPIRKAFAKANGVKPALFSANSEGACPTCNGAGVVYTDLAMMAGVATPCEVCEGKRFQASVLEHHLGGRDISEVLAMSVTEATCVLRRRRGQVPAGARDPGPARRRRARLPQPRPAADDAVRRRAPAAEAGDPHGRQGRRSTSSTSRRPACTSPTSSSCSACSTGSSTRGKSVIVIEHHQAVMAHADWIIDLGPGAGHDGGRIVFEGTPADLVAARSTLTGEHLAAYVGT